MFMPEYYEEMDKEIDDLERFRARIEKRALEFTEAYVDDLGRDSETNYKPALKLFTLAAHVRDVIAARKL